MPNTQTSDTETIDIAGEGTKIVIDEVIKNDKIINKSLKCQICNNVVLLFKVLKKYRKYKSKRL